jgi:hypothetical protein
VVSTKTQGELQCLASKGERLLTRPKTSSICYRSDRLSLVTVLQVVSRFTGKQMRRDVPRRLPLTTRLSTMDLEPQPGSISDEPRSLAFIDGEYGRISRSSLGQTSSSRFVSRLRPHVFDVCSRHLARRLGRLRLVPHPVLSHPPLSQLGFDPILSHPTFDEFKDLLAKKKGTVKGVIMDQAFSAGVGNVRGCATFPPYDLIDLPGPTLPLFMRLRLEHRTDQLCSGWQTSASRVVLPLSSPRRRR